MRSSLTLLLIYPAPCCTCSNSDSFKFVALCCSMGFYFSGAFYFSNDKPNLLALNFVKLFTFSGKMESVNVVVKMCVASLHLTPGLQQAVSIYVLANSLKRHILWFIIFLYSFVLMKQLILYMLHDEAYTI